MVRKLKYFVLLLLHTTLCIIFLIFVYKSMTKESKITYTDFELNSFNSQDAKLAYNGYVVTSHKNKLCLIDSHTKKYKDESFSSNWIGAIADNNAVVYTNKNSLTRCGRIDTDNSTITGNIEILKSDNTTIDPALTRFNGYYYLCLTRINGNINNASKDDDNGLYAIELYRSTNLQNWEFINTIYSAFRNLEDIKFSKSNQLEIIFEEEDYDKGPSKILRSISTNSGKTWTDPILCVDNSSDSEPAALYHLKDNYYIFYSSDEENPGESYQGAEAYYNCYDRDFKYQYKIKIPLKFKKGILLYDVQIVDDKIYFLYSHDYNKENDLVLESFQLNEVGIK